MGSLKQALLHYYYKFFFLNAFARAKAMKKGGYFKKQGDNCYIAGGIAVTSPKSVSLGSNVWLITNCALITHDFSPFLFGKKQNEGEIKIGSNCFIGYGAIVLPGISLGDNTIVGAGSVVAKSFEGNCVIAGNPAVKIKSLADFLEKK